MRRLSMRLTISHFLHRCQWYPCHGNILPHKCPTFLAIPLATSQTAKSALSRAPTWYCWRRAYLLLCLHGMSNGRNPSSAIFSSLSEMPPSTWLSACEDHKLARLWCALDPVKEVKCSAAPCGASLPWKYSPCILCVLFYHPGLSHTACITLRIVNWSGTTFANNITLHPDQLNLFQQLPFSENAPWVSGWDCVAFRPPLAVLGMYWPNWNTNLGGGFDSKVFMKCTWDLVWQIHVCICLSVTVGSSVLGNSVLSLLARL